MRNRACGAGRDGGVDGVGVPGRSGLGSASAEAATGRRRARPARPPSRPVRSTACSRRCSRPSVRSASPAARAPCPGRGCRRSGQPLQIGSDVVVDVRAGRPPRACCRRCGTRAAASSRPARGTARSPSPWHLPHLAASRPCPGCRTCRRFSRRCAPAWAGGTNAITCPGGSVTSEADSQMQAASARSAYGVNGHRQDRRRALGLLRPQRRGGDHRRRRRIHGDLPGVGQPVRLRDARQRARGGPLRGRGRGPRDAADGP